MDAYRSLMEMLRRLLKHAVVQDHLRKFI